jgi:sugar phosphate isomerase/epimerase
VARAAEHGIRLAVENHGDLAAPELAELLDRAGDGYLGICFDTANAVRVDGDAVAAAALLAPRTWMVHLKDVTSPSGVLDPVAGPESVPFGEGVVPLTAILETLAVPVAEGAPVCVELGQLAADADEWAMVEQGVAWLREAAQGRAGTASRS